MKITGTSPLLMHSDRFANPLDEGTKAHKVLTDKKKKTEEDQLAIAKSEFLGSLYYHKTDGIYLPTISVRSSIVGGGKLRKLGKAIQRSTFLIDERTTLQYSGPKNPEDLWNAGTEFVDVRSVVVNAKRIMRYRPKFTDWSVTVSINYDQTQIDRDDLLLCAQDAGAFIGIGDFRPDKGGMFGRFTVEAV